MFCLNPSSYLDTLHPPEHSYKHAFPKTQLMFQQTFYHPPSFMLEFYTKMIICWEMICDLRVYIEDDSQLKFNINIS